MRHGGHEALHFLVIQRRHRTSIYAHLDDTYPFFGQFSWLASLVVLRRCIGYQSNVIILTVIYMLLFFFSDSSLSLCYSQVHIFNEDPPS